MKYDLIVIGGGPAGSAASREASTAGLNVLLLERSEPGAIRPKVCGEALTPSALEWLTEHGLQSVVASALATDGFRLHRNRSDLHRRWPQFGRGFNPVGVNIDRLALDRELRRSATSSGTTLIEGADSLRVHEGARGLAVDFTHLGQVRHATAPLVVLAVGARIGRFSNVVEQQRSMALATRVTLDRNVSTTAGPVDLRFRCVVTPDRRIVGYCWNFPLPGNRANIGAIALPAGNRRVTALDRRAVKTGLTRFEWIETRSLGGFESWPIPIRVTAPSGRLVGTLAVGDAAGAAHPITAEGIGQALRTGSAAGRAASDALDFGGPLRFSAMSKDLLEMASCGGRARRSFQQRSTRWLYPLLK